jgi:hypothetical protein
MDQQILGGDLVLPQRAASTLPSFTRIDGAGSASGSEPGIAIGKCKTHR